MKSKQETIIDELSEDFSSEESKQEKENVDYTVELAILESEKSNYSKAFFSQLSSGIYTQNSLHASPCGRLILAIDRTIQSCNIVQLFKTETWTKIYEIEVGFIDFVTMSSDFIILRDNEHWLLIHLN